MSEVEARGRSASTAQPTANRERTPAAVRAEPLRDEEGSFGRALAAARQARGLSHGDVAAQLRLQVRQVRAIEEEDLAALPEGPFVRGYVRNFARLVDLPAEPLLLLLSAKLKPTDPLLAASKATKAVSPLQPLPREPVSGRLVIGGVLAALVALAVFGWWTMRADEHKTIGARTESAHPAPAVEQPQSATIATAVPEASVAAAADTALRLRFRDVSWVEIRQADGTVLLSQNNAAGTEQTIDGVPPYTLVIGNASKVDLEFRGKPVDLAASASRDDVARLRLE